MSTYHRKINLNEISFSDILMNSNSPRLPTHLKGSTTEGLIPYFLFNESIESLVGSLSVLGWFPTEPLIVQKMYDDKYTVIDGNRRVAACWLMLNTDSNFCPEFIKNIVKTMDPDLLKSLETLSVLVQE